MKLVLASVGLLLGKILGITYVCGTEKLSFLTLQEDITNMLLYVKENINKRPKSFFKYFLSVSPCLLTWKKKKILAAMVLRSIFLCMQTTSSCVPHDRVRMELVQLIQMLSCRVLMIKTESIVFFLPQKLCKL